MNYSLIKSDARERLKGMWGTAVVAVLLFSLISSAIEGIGFVFGDTLSIIGTIAFIIVYGPLSYGLKSLFVKINRKEKTEVGDLFIGFNQSDFTNKMNAGIMIYIYTFLWSLLFIIPGIIASYRYSMTYYIMKDNPKLTHSQAINKSKEMMNGHKMQLFCLDLSFIGWIILGILTCGIGMLWVSAYMETSHARFYEAISGVKTSQTDENIDSQTSIKNEEEINPYQEGGDANVIYRLKCDVCGATDTHTEKSSTCPYCGSKMSEQK